MGDALRNRQWASQQKVFANLKWGSISPTDIDAFLDFGDRLFVFIEVKYGKRMPDTGQRIALERVCDACESPERVSVVLLASHECDGDIHLCDLPVFRYRYNRRWRNLTKDLSVKEAVDLFRVKANLESA